MIKSRSPVQYFVLTFPSGAFKGEEISGEEHKG